MAEFTLPIIQNGVFEQAALKATQDAAARLHLGVTLNICSPEFGADPTGVKDSTAAIQAAVDKGRILSAYGVVTILCPAGVYRVSPPFINIWGYTTIKGDGIGSTIFLIDSSKINESTVENGVFHTGTYNQRIDDSSIFRVTLRDFSIYTTLKSGAPSHSAAKGFQHIAADHMNSKAWGITFNTHLGTGPADPDSVHTIENVEIWDTAGGLALLGLDDQGCKVTNLRVRRTWKQGLLVGKPYDHPEAYEGTARRTGAADNKFVHADISGGNQGAVGCAGIEIYTAQTKFLNSTSWYHRRHAEDIYTKTTKIEGNYATYDSYTKMRDGAGWYIDGTRNLFIGCTSQETGGHGFVVKGSQTQMIACIGESASYFDTAGPKVQETGKGQFMNTAANFYISNWTHTSQMYACRGQNAYKLGEAAKYGIYVEDYIKYFTLDGFTTVNSYGVEADGTHKIENRIPVDSRIGVGSRFEIDGVRTPSSSASASPSPERPWVRQLTPGMLKATRVASWDPASLADGEAVVSLASSGGSAPSGALAQADESKQPIAAGLAGKRAWATQGTGWLQAADIGTSDQWTVALAVAVHASSNGQYLLSCIGAGATNPASIVVTDKRGLRLNSGGGRAGYTAKTADGALTLHKPQVIVMVCDGTTVQAWVDGEKSSEAPVATGAVKPLSGRATLGAYYAGTGVADATFGEAAIFSTALTDDQVAGLSDYLLRAWQK